MSASAIARLYSIEEETTQTETQSKHQDVPVFWARSKLGSYGLAGVTEGEKAEE